MRVQIIKKAAIWLAALAALLIVLLMTGAIFQSRTFKLHNSSSAIAAAILLSGAVIVAAGAAAHYLRHRNSLTIFAVLMVLSIGKLIIMVNFPIQPTSDFYTYHSLAQSVVSGNTWQKMLTDGTLGDNILWPHVLNIAWFFSVFYSFFTNSIIVGQLVSITLSGVSAFLIYVILRKFLDQRVAIFAALLFYALPAFWLYSILNAPESFFLVFLLGSVLCYYDALYTVNDTNTKNFFYLALSLLLLFLANMIRPVVLVWIIVIVLVSLLGLPSQRISGKRLLARAAVFAVLFSGLSAAAIPIYRMFYGIDLAPGAVLQNYSIATGTSVTTGGQYNATIRRTVDKILDQPHQSRNTRYQRIIRQMGAITSNNLHTIKRTGVTAFVWQKVKNYMDENYGADWLLYNTQGSTAKRFTATVLPFVSVYAVVYFAMILLLTASAITAQLVMMWRRPGLSNRAINLLFYGTLAVDGFFLSALLLEVQGRYHIVLYLPIIVLLALGGQLISQQLHQNEKEV